MPRTATTRQTEVSVTGDYIERPWAVAVHDGLERKRNGCIVAHRRAGKTVCVVAQVIRDVFACPHPNAQGAYIAPTAKQARTVAWPYFYQMLRELPGVRFREHEMAIDLPGGRRILMASGEQYDRLRGLYLDVAVVDEMADCPESLITTVLRPALADRQGKLIVIGTVKGRGPFWQMYERACTSEDWFAGLFTPDMTNALPESELEFLRREMSEDEYQQELMCNPDAAVKGAYYGKAMQELQEGGFITRVPYDPALPVTVAMDLGMADSTAIWFAQLMTGGEVRLVEYREYQNTSFIQILTELEALPYRISRWIGPHDLKVREFTSGQSRYDSAFELGVVFDIAPKMPVIDGIEAVRRALPRCVFDAEKCRDGINSLRLYRSQWDETKRVLSRNPVHDMHSHAADAMRYLITATNGGQRNLFADLAPIDYGD